MENSPLSKFPGEIRNRIWEAVLQHSDPIVIEELHPVEFYPYSTRARPRHPPIRARRCAIPQPLDTLAITATCKALRTETGPMFFGMNTFCFPVRQDWKSPADRFNRFRGSLSPRHAAAINSVYVAAVTRGEGYWIDSGLVMKILGMIVDQDIMTGLRSAWEIAKTCSSVKFRFNLAGFSGVFVVDMCDARNSWRRTLYGALRARLFYPAFSRLGWFQWQVFQSLEKKGEKFFAAAIPGLLGRLPGELRNEIYKLVLQRDEPIVLGEAGLPVHYKYRYCKESRTPKRTIGSNLHLLQTLALTSTCKAIRRETIEMFFDINTFSMYETPMLTNVPEMTWQSTHDYGRIKHSKLLRRLAPAHARALNRVDVHCQLEAFCGQTHPGLTEDLLRENLTQRIMQSLTDAWIIAWKSSRVQLKFSLPNHCGPFSVNMADARNSWRKVLEDVLAAPGMGGTQYSDLSVYQALEEGGRRFFEYGAERFDFQCAAGKAYA